MFKLFLFCIFALALKGAFAATIKTVVQKTVTADIFDEVNVVRKNIEDTITSLMPETKNITAFVLASSKEFADSIEKSVSAIKQQVNKLQGVVESSIKEFATKVVHSTNKLKEIAKNTMEQAKKSVAAVTVQVKTIFNDVQVAVQSNTFCADGKLTKSTEKFFNDVISAGKRFQLDLLSAQAKNKAD